MKRAPKELLDALRGIAERNSGLYVENGAQELLALLEDWQPESEDGVGSAVEILRKDVAEWKKRATEAEARADKSERLATLACEFIASADPDAYDD